MIKILQLLIDDFKEQTTCPKYQLELNKACKAEKEFLSSLTEEQREKFSELQIMEGDLDSIIRDEFAEFLHKYIGEFYGSIKT